MDYKKIYDQLMDRAKNRIIEGYYENHHIIPRCMGGDDSKENIVKLTAKEHFIAHELLFKEYRTTKLAHAWFSMLRCDPNQERKFTAYQYDIAKKAHSNALKESIAGEGNHFYGRTHSDESKLKISIANSGRIKNPKEIENWVEKVAKMPKTKEHRSKIGRNNLVMLKNISTNECIRVDKSQVILYDKNLWKNPTAISQKREKCIYCKIESVSGNIKRWHNENCKHNPSR